MADLATPPLPGPDLVAVGLALTDLADGTMTTGHAHGEAVLLARRGAEIFAITAKCSHLGAPLGKGLLVGDTVRCPWHHACFSLRTGEALRAPALTPQPCWTVEPRNGRAYVTHKQTRDPLAPAGPVADASAHPVAVVIVGAGASAHPVAVVIVGAGAAGSAAAEMLRREGYQGSIKLLDGEAAAPYDRTFLSKSFPADKEKPIALRPAGFYAEHNIELVPGEVMMLDVPGRRVLLADGSAHAYDRMLLATGAAPIKLSIPGHDLPHVHVLRSLADHRAITAGAKDAKWAVVIGASFIGLEVAAALRGLGLEVHVVAPDKVPLAKVLGPELGAMVQKLHEEKGVIFHLGLKAERIETGVVVLENGEQLPADLVVVGIGVRPRLALAEAAGLTIDKGVAVNEYLESSAPGIFAAGDIARWPDPHSSQNIRVEHWALAQRQGQTAARNMLGQREKFEAVPFFWSKHYDLSIRYTGHAEKWDAAPISGDLSKQEFSIAYKSEGRTMAVASVKRDLENLKAEVALEADDEIALGRLLAGADSAL
jgi:NADPH-dependent 2,4-dienoyl-CoA reductase/sulfur reductase-like enzyme/nitrite reductase/ring-hydroxylating ferredoxin subunit